MNDVIEAQVIVSREKSRKGDHVTITEKETGEILSTHWEIKMRNPPGKKPRKVKQPPYAKLWMPNLIKLVLDKKLSGAEKALLFDLLAFLDWQSTMLVHPLTGKPVNESGIADVLKMNRSHVHDTLKSLNEKGIIGKFNAGKGKPCKYHMNYHLFHYGEKMNDILDICRFDGDCAYEPPVKVEFEIEKDSKKMIRRDLTADMGVKRKK